MVEKTPNHRSGVQIFHKKLASVFDAIPDMISISDKHGNRIFGNAKFREFFGLDAADLNKVTPTFKTALEKQRYFDQLKQLSPQQPSVSNTHFLHDKDGNGKWIQWSETAVFDENGVITEILSIGRDVSEMKLNEDSLAFSLKEIELIGSITQIALAKNPKSNICKSILEAYHNVTDSAVVRFFSFSKEENHFCLEAELKNGEYTPFESNNYIVPLDGIGINLMSDVNNNTFVFKRIGELIQLMANDYHSAVKDYLTKVESEIPGCSLILLPLLTGGSIAGLVTVVTENTSEAVVQRLRHISEQATIIFSKIFAVEAMEKQKIFHNTILNKLPIDIAVFNTELQYVFINEMAIKNPELRNWVIGKTDFEFCTHRNFPITLAEKRLQHLKLGLSGISTEYVETMKTKNGHRYYLRVIHPILESGKVKYLIGYGVEITGLKKAEFATTEHIHQLEKIAFSTSHELRQPIVNLQALIQLFEMEHSEPEKQKLMECIKKSVNAMDVYTRELALELHSYRRKMNG